MPARALCATLGLLLVGACAEPQTGRVSDVGGGESFQSMIGDRVFFDVDSTQLKTEWRRVLNRQAAWLKQYPHFSIVIEGHTDERGSHEYNLALGARRAQTIASYLAVQGVPASRMKTISYGKQRPEVVGSDEGAWSRNRRGVTTLQ